MRALCILASLTSIACAAAITASAQSPAEYYRGKDIRIIVGYTSGGGYDSYARAVAQVLGREIPGNPTVIVQNMPGADGLTATNYMAQLAPRDGTAIGFASRNLVVAPLLGLIDPSRVHYDPTQLEWIANLNSEIAVLVVRGDLGIQTIDDLRRQEVTVGASGLTSDNATYPIVINNVLGTRLKVVTGYPGTSEMTLALERGEVGGIGGWAWSSLKVQHPDWIKNKVIVPLLQLGLESAPGLENVPLVLDLVHNDDERRALELVFAPEELGRAFFAPPGSSAQAVQILRDAFAAMVDDPEFKDVAKRARLDIAFTNGDTVQKLVARLNSASPDVSALARRILKRADDQNAQ
jgi:tripartite-type tricarboxylate transporter receptor subunit TctC